MIKALLLTAYLLGHTAISMVLNAPISPADQISLTPPEVCNWADNKTAAISVTIDDGHYESAVKFNELQKKYNVHSTQFLITDTIAGNEERVKGWSDIFSEGYMDIGNHSAGHEIRYDESDSYTADELDRDINGAYTTLKELFPEQDVLAFATPWGQNSQITDALIREKHYANRSVGGGIVYWDTSVLYKLGSHVITFDTTAEELNSMTDKAISGGGWYIQLHHSLGDEGNAGDLITDITACEKHFEYIKEQSDAGKLWSGSFNDVIKYICERKTAKIEMLWTGKRSIGLRLTDDMGDDDLFDYPITLKVYLPDSWNGRIKVIQKSGTAIYPIESEDGVKFAYINVVPDRGNTIIKMNAW